MDSLAGYVATVCVSVAVVDLSPGALSFPALGEKGGKVHVHPVFHFLFTPLGPEFSCCYRSSARSITPHFSLILTPALKWSRHGPPSFSGGPCPPDLWWAGAEAQEFGS
jgi:hypothetical protein